MRRDVRLLGDLLGEVIRESGGQDLLDDVERLRRAVIAARAGAEPADGTAASEIAALVGGWPLDRAELVARAFTVYFHLTNLAEEQQRIRTLRERDTGEEPRARVAGRRRGRARASRAGAARRAARPAAGAPGAHRPPHRGAPARGGHRAAADQRRCSTRWTTPAPRRGRARRGPAPAAARRSTCCGARPAPLRVKPMDPLDEVRTVMAVVRRDAVPRGRPPMYRALDAALARRRRRHRARRRPRVPALRQLGRRRPGRQPATSPRRSPGRPAAIQADHVLRALENAATRIGRALTVHAGPTPPVAGAARARWPPPRRRTPSCSPRSARARRRSRTGSYLLYAGRTACAPPGCATPTWPTPARAEFLADLRAGPGVRWPRPGPPGRRTASCST